MLPLSRAFESPAHTFWSEAPTDARHASVVAPVVAPGDRGGDGLSRTGGNAHLVPSRLKIFHRGASASFLILPDGRRKQLVVGKAPLAQPESSELQEPVSRSKASARSNDALPALKAIMAAIPPPPIESIGQEKDALTEPPPALPPKKPPRGGAVALTAAEKNQFLQPHLGMLGELTGRMTRHTGIRGWWRKRFGPKPVLPGNEVLEMARRIGVPLMQALRNSGFRSPEAVESQLGGLLGEWYGKTFNECRPASGKHWRQRVSRRGSGVFAQAWKLARADCDRSVRKADRDSAEYQRAVATLCVLNALHSAPLQPRPPSRDPGARGPGRAMVWPRAQSRPCDSCWWKTT